MNSILEGLNKRVLNKTNKTVKEYHDPYEDMSIDDQLVVTDSIKFKDAIESGLNKKYKKQFSDIGDFKAYVEFELKDDDDIEVEDILDYITISIYIDNSNADKKDVINRLESGIKAFRGLDIKYDKRDESYLLEVEGMDDCYEFLVDLEKDCCPKVSKFYELLDKEDIRSHLSDRYRKYKADQDELNRYYYSTRL